jgi:hypothetical protein
MYLFFTKILGEYPGIPLTPPLPTTTHPHTQHFRVFNHRSREQLKELASISSARSSAGGARCTPKLSYSIGRRHHTSLLHPQSTPLHSANGELPRGLEQDRAQAAEHSTLDWSLSSLNPPTRRHVTMVMRQ